MNDINLLLLFWVLSFGTKALGALFGVQTHQSINPNQLNQNVKTESIKSSCVCVSTLPHLFFTQVGQALLVFGRRLARICARGFTTDVCVGVAPSMCKSLYNKLLCNLTEKIYGCLIFLHQPHHNPTHYITAPHHKTNKSTMYPINRNKNIDIKN